MMADDATPDPEPGPVPQPPGLPQWVFYAGLTPLPGSTVGKSEYITYTLDDANRPDTAYYAPVWVRKADLSGYEQVHTAAWVWKHYPYRLAIPDANGDFTLEAGFRQFVFGWDARHFPGWWFLWPKVGALQAGYVSVIECNFRDSKIHLFARALGRLVEIDIGGYGDINGPGEWVPGPIRIHSNPVPWAEIGGVYFKDDRLTLSKHIVTISDKPCLKVENNYDQFFYVPLFTREELEGL